VDLAMRLLGRQFVTGRTIEEALDNAREREERGYTFSFDMLGEAAMTARDAEPLLQVLRRRDPRESAGGQGSRDARRPGISVKLSALHPRFSRAQRERVVGELIPRVALLAKHACDYDIGFNIDSRKPIGSSSRSTSLQRSRGCKLAGWEGLGFVVQSYQKRAREVIDWLVALARRHRRRLMVRLVKGAYWDSEIKRAQVDGARDYPVFTRKVHTDVSYLACARAMLAAPEPCIRNSRATTRSRSLRLHACRRSVVRVPVPARMGESIYDQIVGKDKLDRACRIYAPVGSHETLLAYLVRRLLENGANSSFVNRIVDPSVSIASLVADPVAQAEKTGGTPHPAIPLPVALLPGRRNSRGADLSDDTELASLHAALAEVRFRATPAPILARQRRSRRAFG
jgi:RHH-type proline utilization regulon transcriptional repressor/proline dehydrogenase/delta 1-pyrroline-5-carboxylate dehydrogenase